MMHPYERECPFCETSDIKLRAVIATGDIIGNCNICKGEWLLKEVYTRWFGILKTPEKEV